MRWREIGARLVFLEPMFSRGILEPEELVTSWVPVPRIPHQRVQAYAAGPRCSLRLSHSGCSKTGSATAGRCRRYPQTL